MSYSYGRRLAYFNSCPRQSDPSVRVAEAMRPAVAISPQTGSGALQIAEGLAEYFRMHAPAADGGLLWRVFAKDLMAKVLEDHHLPAHMAASLVEDASNPVEDVLYELLGVHPASWVFVPDSIETVLKLVRAGNVILVGWGSNVITRKLPNVFHVRLVGSVECRVARLQARQRLSPKGALALIEQGDRGRERYVRRHFHQQLSDVLLYDLTINTDHFSDAEVVRLIGDAVLTRNHSPQAEARTLNASPTVSSDYGPRRHEQVPGVQIH